MGADEPPPEEDRFSLAPTVAFVISVVTAPVWIFVVAPATVWVIVSAGYHVVHFTISILNGPPISPGRWLAASAIMVSGIVAEVWYLHTLIFGTSRWQIVKRVMACLIPVFLFLNVIMAPLNNGFIWLTGFIIPMAWVYFPPENPVSFGHAIGTALGLLCWPLLFAAGLAKGALASGYPAVEMTCSVIREAAASGLLDVSTAYNVAWEIVSIFYNVKLFEALGFQMFPPFYSLNWWGVTSLAAYVEVGAEVAGCYASGALTTIAP
ncbi:hypothetical protein ACFYE9_07275 [Rhizobium leguminosarum]|uniref:Uncharacterized protein n=2 Tax=Rhizobium leguminosarum TaxID=384 RepID=A0A154IFW7_RHILE|nr:hypothetical protein [Rhizobium leguminosarum]KZA99301.1 hypothetical protein A4A59_23110 [Rhizobium leguminosarum]